MNYVDSQMLLPSVAGFLETSSIEFRVLECDPSFADTAQFCEKYGFAAEDTANTILVASKKEPIKYACCVVLSHTKLDVNKRVCKLLGVKKASFASGDLTIELTGMEIGGVTPFGIPEMPVYLDSRISARENIVLGGGNRTSKIVLNPAELSKIDGAELIEDLALPR